MARVGSSALWVYGSDKDAASDVGVGHDDWRLNQVVDGRLFRLLRKHHVAFSVISGCDVSEFERDGQVVAMRVAAKVVA